MSQETKWFTTKKGANKKVTYEGTKNKTEFKFFVEICKTDKDLLKEFLYKKLGNFYPDVVKGGGYVYAKGTNCPILLTAHMDTVHSENVKTFYEKKFYNSARKRYEHKISSPQGIGGDDRCGIYMILNILMETEFRPSILFCEDEEIGGVGSKKFVKDEEFVADLKELKYFIELDRANAYDAVYYDCGNKEFQSYVESFGFEEDWGSFSDIGHLSPPTDIASVNLSCGYYEQHTIGEYVIVEEMYDTIKKVKEMLADAENAKQFDYQEVKYASYGSDSWYENLLDYYKGNKPVIEEFFGMEITYLDENKTTQYEFYNLDNNEDEYTAFGKFFIDHPTVCYEDVIDYQIVY